MIQHQVLPARYNAEYSDAQYAPKQYGDQYQYQEQPPSLPPPPQKLWGLKPKTFWMIFAGVSIVVIGAAVGGGVGAAVSHKSSSSNTKANSTTPTPTTSDSSPSLTTTPVIGPSATLLRDCPSSNNTLYTVSPNSANPQTFRKLCDTTFTNAISDPSSQNVVNTKTTSLDDCIGLCGTYNEANKTGIAANQDLVCNAVCWRNGFAGDDFPGNCFGFTTLNSTGGGFETNQEIICDGAGWIDQRTLT
jgi:hypothetical protein